MKKIKVVSGKQERVVAAGERTNLLDLLRASGLFVDAPCGGQGTCGKCGVWVNDEWRLACRTIPSGGEIVTVPRTTPFIATGRDEKLEEGLNNLDHSPLTNASGEPARFGVAVDLGTTTISTVLLDLAGRSIVGSIGFYNPQIMYGADVINRIIFSLQGDGRTILQTVVVREIARAVDHLCASARISPDEIGAMAVAGNTAMQHFFLGIDARYIREEPYEPVTKIFPPIRAAEVFQSLKMARLFLLPCVANYLGADMVSGAAACGLDEGDGVSVLLDLGTNGEIMIGNRDWLAGCACSAGPAFEGMGLSCGMRHKDGAITGATVQDKQLRLDVEGGARPEGISGTGALSLIACLRDLGFIDQRGRFTDHVTGQRNGRKAFFIHGDQGSRPVFLDEPDIDNLIRAKAAIFAGLRLLLKKLSLDYSDIQRFHVAGGLGTALDLSKATRVGLLPPLAPGRVIPSGNTSLQGALRFLISEPFRQKVARIGAATTYIDLSYEPGYMDEFVAALFLPHTDLGLFS
jgi:uncharacterized 2Fe-2S/4Fe-4S cluster protein (DUF4445 family)